MPEPGSSNASVADPSTPLLRVVGLCKNFGKLQVLDRVSLEVKRTQVVGIIGPSGSGKSTFLRCLNWIERPTSGAIYLEDERIGTRVSADGKLAPLSNREIARQRQRMAMVFQSFNLWPHLTVLQNLTLGPVTVLKRPQEEARSEALGILGKVGLLEKADEFPCRLSGGQQQRVGIARALAMQPSVMLFDEPTSALDPETVQEVLSVMLDLAREGHTMIVVTHEMGFAHDACDSICLLNKGAIVDQGSPDHIFRTSANLRTRDFVRRYVRDLNP